MSEAAHEVVIAACLALARTIPTSPEELRVLERWLRVVCETAAESDERP
jgi:hypothetical protein